VIIFAGRTVAATSSWADHPSAFAFAALSSTTTFAASSSTTVSAPSPFAIVATGPSTTISSTIISSLPIVELVAGPFVGPFIAVSSRPVARPAWPWGFQLPSSSRVAVT
jgi:hypothetical protein